MNVTSQSISKRLYELSLWVEGVSAYTSSGMLVNSVAADAYYPAYTLGFLLRKLPAKLDDYYNDDGRRCTSDFSLDAYEGKWEAGHEGVFFKEADTPEDAAALLAIKLFEEGILTNERSDT